MEVIDLTGISYFIPLLSFLLILIVVFAVLKKIEIVENPWLNVFISFIVASIFVSAVGVRELVTSVTPWFAALLVLLFFVLVFIGFVGKDDNFQKGIMKVFVVILIAVFVIVALIVFSSILAPYMPGNASSGGNQNILRLTNWIYSPRVAGTILLLVLGAIFSWVLVKGNKGKGK